ncbi:MAG: hypothetical protein WD942_11290 [Dehalococcoidia bacterium]
MPTAVSFRVMIDDYIATVDSLRSLLRNVAPEISQRERESMTLQGILKRLNVGEAHAAKIEAAWDIERARIVGEFRAGDAEPHLTDVMASLDSLPQEAKDEILEQLASREAMFTVPVLSAFPDGIALGEFVRRTRSLARPISTELFNRFILTSAFSSFEGLVYAMVENYYSAKHEEVVKGSSEAEFSLSDLMAYETLEDALEEAVQKRIENFLFKGFSSWARWWQSELSVNWQAYAPEWSLLLEALERRHCVTHNSARATRKYLRSVPESERDSDLSVGDLLRTDPRYLARVLDDLLVLGCMVAFETWRRVESPIDAQAFGSSVVAASFEMLQQERWKASSDFCSFALKHLGLADGEKLLALCNRWIAEKYRANSEIDLREEVSAWHVGHLSNEFSVARAALLDDFDALPGLVRVAVASGDIAVSNLRSWPLFRSFRETDGFLPLLTELEEDLEPLNLVVRADDEQQGEKEGTEDLTNGRPAKEVEECEGKASSHDEGAPSGPLSSENGE